LATIYDVARRAGVSPKTVSRVLNGDAPVNATTRATVEAAIAELSYVPSNAARSMRSQRSGLIGIITGAISTSSANEPSGLPDLQIVQGAQRVLSDNGLTVLISDTGGNVERVPELVQTLLEHRVEGLIYVAEYHQRVSFPQANAADKLVLVNCYDEEGTTAILPDDEGGQFSLVKGLIERGHRRIGFLTLPEQHVARGLRLEGYERALIENGIAYDPALVLTGALSNPAHEFDLLWDAVDRLLADPNPPTVICCGNDKMAMRLYGLLRDRGVRIPEDMSVVGYDDYRIISEHLHPRLTTVELPYAAMGARAAGRLIRSIRGEEAQAESSVERVSGPVSWRQSVTTRDRTVIDFNATRSNEK